MNTSHTEAGADLSDISIVVLSYNRKDTLKRNLSTLTGLAHGTGCEIIVVDNASTDGSPEMIAAFITDIPNARFIANDKNLGVAGGRNTGWRAAERAFILNIDDDTLVTEEAVARMLSEMHAHPELGIISPRILHAVTGAAQLSFDKPRYQLSNFHGACHLVRRSVIDAVGLNDEYCTFGGEELDLSIRARAAGFDISYIGHATVLHDNLVRTGEVGRERRQHWIYNFIRVFHKHFPLRTALPFSLRYLTSHLVTGVRVYGLCFAPNLINAAWRGFRDGRRKHNTVPTEVVRFYHNPDLRPEFGNVPLWRKLANKAGSRRAVRIQD